MLLNLCIIRDYLKNHKILEEKIDRMSDLTLQKVRLYHFGDIFEPSVLYIATAEELPPTPEINIHVSILCLGFLPSVYNTLKDCETLCFSSSTDPAGLFQDVLQVFYTFNEYDSKIKDMIIASEPMENFGKLAVKLFDAPVSAYGIFEKILFVCYDETRPESRELYASYTDEYLPEDEKSILYSDFAFRNTLSVKGPAVPFPGIQGI